MIDFNKLIDEGWVFSDLDIEDYHTLRLKLRRIEELPDCYAIARDEIGTPSFKRQRNPGPSCFYASKGAHIDHGEIFIFANPNDEGFILAQAPLPDLLGLKDNGR